MAFKIVQNETDIDKVFTVKGKMSEGYTGEVYDAQMGAVGEGQKRILENSKGMIRNSISEIIETARENGKQIAIDYNKERNTYTIMELPTGVSQSELNNGYVKNNQDKVGQMSFNLPTLSGFIYGENSNKNVAVRKNASGGSKGFPMMLKMAEAEVYEASKNYKINQDNGRKKAENFSSALTKARKDLRAAYTKGASGAQDELNKSMNVRGKTENFMAENAGNSQDVLMGNYYRLFNFMNEVDQWEEKQTGIVFWELAKYKDKVKGIKEVSQKYQNFIKDRYKREKALEEIAEFQKKYNFDPENITFTTINENSLGTGNVFAYKEAGVFKGAGNRPDATRYQGVQRVDSRVIKNDPHVRSSRRSTAAEQKMGLNRGRALEVGKMLPDDAYVMGLEVNSYDKDLKGHITDDNVLVRENLLKNIGGERAYDVKYKNQEDFEDDIVKTIKQMKKDHSTFYVMKDGKLVRYTGSMDRKTRRNAGAKSASKWLENINTFKDLNAENGKIILERTWFNNAIENNRDANLDNIDNVELEIDNVTGIRKIKGTEHIKGQQGMKIVGGMIKGSADTAEDVFKEKRFKDAQFIIGTKKGDERKGATLYTDPDFNALFAEYNENNAKGLHSNLGTKGLFDFINALSKDDKADKYERAAAKIFLQTYDLHKDENGEIDGYIQKTANSFIDNLKKDDSLSEDKKVQTLAHLTPLIDRLINGIEKNTLITKEEFEKREESERYYNVNYKDGKIDSITRTTKDRRVWEAIHHADEYDWKGVNLVRGIDSLGRAAGLTYAQLDKSDRESINTELKKNNTDYEKVVKSIQDKIDISEDRKKEFSTKKSDAISAINAINDSATMSNINWGVDEANDKVLVRIGKDIQSSDLEIDINDIEEAKRDAAGNILNEDKLLPSVLAEKRKKIKDYYKNTYKKDLKDEQIQFAIDTGNYGKIQYDKDGKMTSRIGGKAFYIPTRMSDDGYENYAKSISRVVRETKALNENPNNDNQKERLTNTAIEAMKDIENDFQNKGSVYEKYYGERTPNAIAGRELPMYADWISKAYKDKQTKEDKVLGDVATVGSLISAETAREDFDRIKNVKGKKGKAGINDLFERFYNDKTIEILSQNKVIDDEEVKKLKSKLTYAQKIDYIIKALTLRDENGKMPKIAKTLINAEGGDELYGEGLRAILSRLPFSNGLDLASTRKVFIDATLKEKNRRNGLAHANAFNADWDGDITEMLLNTDFNKEQKLVFDANAKREEKLGKTMALIKFKKMLEDSGYELDTKSGKYTRKTENGEITALTQENLKNMLDSNISYVAATGMRIGKGNVGGLSNIATEYRNMMKENGLDALALLKGDKVNDKGAQANAANSLLSSVFFEGMEQDAISSKKIINRLAKIKGNYTDDQLSQLSEDEIFSTYYDAVQDINGVLKSFYDRTISFSDLMEKLRDVGLLDKDYNLENGRVMQKAIGNIIDFKDAEGKNTGIDILKNIFGETLKYGKEEYNFSELMESDPQKLEEVLMAQNMSRDVIKKVLEGSLTALNNSGNVHYDSIDDMLRALPMKQFTAEKKIIKERDVGTSKNLKNVDKEWLEHIQTLEEAENASISEAQAEENKIKIAEREALAILKLKGSYDSLGETLDTVKASEEAFGKSKYYDTIVGATTRIHEQTGQVFQDSGFAKDLQDLKETNTLVVDGKTYRVENLLDRDGNYNDSSKRKWTDVDEKAITDEEEIKKLNRLGYDKKSYEFATGKYGALNYGNIAHTTSEYMQKMGDSDWAKFISNVTKGGADLNLDDEKTVKAIIDYIPNKIKKLTKSKDEEKRALGEKLWAQYNEGPVDEHRHHSGGLKLFSEQYANQLRGAGLNEKEINKKLAEFILTGVRFGSVVSRNGTFLGTADQESSVPLTDKKALMQSEADSVVYDRANRKFTVYDYKTKTGKISDYEYLQPLKYAFSYRTIAEKILDNNYKDGQKKKFDTIETAQNFMDEFANGKNGNKNSWAFAEGRPLSEETFTILKTMVDDIVKDVNEDKTVTNKEYAIKQKLAENFNAGIVHGNYAHGEISFLDPKIFASTIHNKELADFVQRIVINGETFREADGDHRSDKDIFKEYFNTSSSKIGRQGYQIWGEGIKGYYDEMHKKGFTDEEIEGKIDQDKDLINKKVYIEYLKEELSIEKQIAEAKHRQKLAEDTGKDAAGIEKEIENLEKYKETILDSKKQIEDESSDKSIYQTKDGNYVDPELQKIKKKNEAQLEFYEKGLEKEDPEYYLTEYKKSSSQLVTLEGQIYQYRLKANTSLGNERDAYEDVISLLEKKHNKLKAINETNKTNAENISKEAAAEIEADAEIQKKLLLAQKLAGNKGMTSLWDVIGRDIRRATMRVTDFGIAAKLLNTIPQDIQKIIQYTKQLDQAMTNIRTVTGKNREEAEALMISYNKLAKQLGATTNEIANSANTWLRQGYAAEEAGILIDASMKLSKLGMISSEEASKNLTSALKGFRMEAIQAIDIVDKLTTMDQNAAISAGEAATALSKMATSAQLAGVNMDEALGIVTEIVDVTQKSADSVGESVKTVLSRFGNVKAGTFLGMDSGDAEDNAKAINDIEKVLGKLGIKVRSSDLEMRDFMDVMDDLAKKWDTLSTVEKNAVATSLGGTRQRENVLVMLENWDRVKELAEESANSTGTANKKYEAYMDSMEAATKRLQNAWEGLSQSIKGSDILKFFTKLMASMVENIDKILPFITSLGWLIGSKTTINFMDSTISGAKDFLGGLFNTNKESIFTRTRKITYDDDGNMNIGKLEGRNDILTRKISDAIDSTKTHSELAEINETTKQMLSVQQAQANGQPVPDKTTDGPNKIVNMKEGRWGKKIFTTNDDKRFGYNKKSGKYQYIDKDGKFTDENVDDNLAKDASKITKKSNVATIGAMSVAGVTTALAAMSQKSYAGGDNWATTLGIVDKDKIGDQQIEDPAASTAKGITQGLGAALSQLPMPWGLIGTAVTTLAPIVIDGISTIVHQEELMLKQEVENARQNLTTLGDIESAIKENSNLFKTTVLSSENYTELYSLVNTIQEKLVDIYSVNYNSGKNFEKIAVEAYSDDTTKTLDDIYEALTSSDAAERKKAYNAIELATAKQELEETKTTNIGKQKEYSEKIKQSQDDLNSFKYITIKSGQINTEAYEILKTLNKSGTINYNVDKDSGEAVSYGDVVQGGRKISEYGLENFSISGSTTDEKISNAEKLLLEMQKANENNIFDKTIKDTQKYISTLKEANEEWDKMIKAEIEAKTKVALLSSNIYNLSNNQLKDLTLSGAIQKIADQIGGARDELGYIKEEYKEVIEQMIKSDSELSALTDSDTKSIKELIKAQDDFANAIKNTGYNYYQLLDMLNKGKLQDTIGETEGKINKTVEELSELIYAADPNRIVDFANAWNMTTDAAKELAEKLPNLTTALGLMGIDEITEKYENLNDILTELKENSSLSFESVESLMEQYPDLYEKYTTGKNEELANGIYDKLINEQMLAKVNAYYNDLMSSESVFDQFKKSEGYSDTNGLLEDVDVESFSGALSYINEKINSGAKGWESAKKAVEDYIKSIETTFKIDNPFKEMYEELKVEELDREIDNLQEQKNLIGQINDERKKELELIKAKEALENAKKEKVKVYRAGIGFTYEANEDAINEAQNKLDDLENERRQESLQYQIDSLQNEKDILESINDNETFNTMKDLLERISENTDINNLPDDITYSPGTGFTYKGTTFDSLNAAYAAKQQTNTENAAKLFGGTYTDEKGNKQTVENNVTNEQQEIYEAIKKGTWSSVAGHEFKSRNEAISYLQNSYTEANNIFSSIDSSYLTEEQKKKYNEYSALQSLISSLEQYDAQQLDFDFGSNGQASKYDKDDDIHIKFKDIDYDDDIDFNAGNLVNDGEKVDALELAVKDSDKKDGKAKKGKIVYHNDGLYISWGDKVWSQLEPDKDDDSASVSKALAAIRDKYNLTKNATGTESFVGGKTLINELGTEAIITPEGTLTSLPSKSGIIPADITKNLWSLGEIAPTLVARLGSLSQSGITSNLGGNTYEEGQYIDNLTMNVYPTKDYDMDKFLAEVRAKQKITKHNN